MPILLIVLILAVAVMYWRYRSSGLTRNCRWRLSRRRGVWHCAFCGAETTDGGRAPNDCLNPNR